MFQNKFIYIPSKIEKKLWQEVTKQLKSMSSVGKSMRNRKKAIPPNTRNERVKDCVFTVISNLN